MHFEGVCTPELFGLFKKTLVRFPHLAWCEQRYQTRIQMKTMGHLLQEMVLVSLQMNSGAVHLWYECTPTSI